MFCFKDSQVRSRLRDIRWHELTFAGRQVCVDYDSPGRRNGVELTNKGHRECQGVSRMGYENCRRCKAGRGG